MPNRNNSSKKNQAESNTKLNPRPKCLNIDIISGALTGIACTGLLNPWDRALYLSIKHERPVLSRENFKAPYQGFSQAMFQKVFSSVIYYTMQSQLNSYLYPYLLNNLGLNNTLSRFGVGLASGSVSGILTNSLSAVKYYTWGDESRSFASSAKEMWSLGGVQPFFKGIKATIMRDTFFGFTYESVRHSLYTKLKQRKILESNDSQLKLTCDGLAAGLAAVTSGPFNYARSILYSTPPNSKPMPLGTLLSSIWNESKNYRQSPLSRFSFLQKKFGISWGVSRVAIGIALGQKIFDTTQSALNNLKNDVIETSSKDKKMSA